MQNVIQLANINKHYGHFALDNINLTLPAGEIMGLVGVNGAGKSTTIRILMGLIEADSGSVEVLGHQLPDAQVAAKRQVGFASEDMRLYKHQDLKWHMDFVRGFYPEWDADYARMLLQKFRLNPTQAIKGFSHGQRVKASLLLLLARRPRLLILDEPTTGLDPVARSEMLEELADILRDENRSVLFSSHNTHDVEQLSDSITFLHDGHILASQGIECFLDKWRNVRCTGQATAEALAELQPAHVRQNGSVWHIKMDNFQPSVLEAIKAQGLEVVDVMRMSLEEIFIATVKKDARYEH
ncbi:MAG TPA: ABC transporter ATP-binding protein [Cellvibrionaceae bacterium]